MKLAGMELRYFRSIGAEGVRLHPLRKCNILIGPNNVGKSNVLRAVQWISNRYQSRGPKGLPLDEIDHFMRQGGKPFQARLFFELSAENEKEAEIQRLMEDSIVWFEATSEPSTDSGITDSSFAELSNFRQANSTLFALTGSKWPSVVRPSDIRTEFLKRGNQIFDSFFRAAIPQVFVIPEFRQIRPGEQYALDGEGLIDLLARYENPGIGRDSDRTKFDEIQEFTRRLLNLPTATLSVTREEPKELIIKDGDLRLPSSSYGTGVHELLILVTAVLSVDRAICCIEEPEIHLHPRLQRTLIEFLLRDTTNQYLISSHSPSLVNYLQEELQVVRLSVQGGATAGKPVDHAIESLRALRDLGLRPSDLLQSNCVIWVEGLSDRVYIGRWLELLAPDLNEGGDFVFMHYSGLPPLHVDPASTSEDLLTEVLKINQNAIIVLDSDRKSKTEPLDAKKERLCETIQSTGGLAWVTDGREIENYLPSQVLQTAVASLRGVDVQVHMESHDELDQVLNAALASAGGKPIDYTHNKLAYSRKIAECFSPEDISGNLKAHIEEIAGKIREWKA